MWCDVISCVIFVVDFFYSRLSLFLSLSIFPSFPLCIFLRKIEEISLIMPLMGNLLGTVGLSIPVAFQLVRPLIRAALQKSKYLQIQDHVQFSCSTSTDICRSGYSPITVSFLTYTLMNVVVIIHPTFYRFLHPPLYLSRSSLVLPSSSSMSLYLSFSLSLSPSPFVLSRHPLFYIAFSSSFLSRPPSSFSLSPSS